MRIFIVLSLLVFLCGSALAQSINHSTSTKSSQTNSDSAVGTTANCNTCGATLNVPSGALLFVGCKYGNLTTVNSVTDDAGDTFTSFTAQTQGGATSQAWYALNAIANASESFKCNLAASVATSKEISVGVYTGALTASALDNFAGGTGNSANPATANIVVNQNNEIIIAYVSCGGGGETPGVSFTTRQDDTTVGTLLEDRGNGGGLASGTYTATATCTSGNWSITGAAFKAAPAKGFPVIY